MLHYNPYACNWSGIPVLPRRLNVGSVVRYCYANTAYFLIFLKISFLYLQGLPFPLFFEPNVGNYLSQFGHTNLKFSILVFCQCPSIWSAIRGMGFSCHSVLLHILHLCPSLFNKYFLIKELFLDNGTNLVSPERLELSIPYGHLLLRQTCIPFHQRDL